MSDLIAEWNEIIDFHISQKDLHQPSFEFFYNALEAILRKLNVNVHSIKENIPDHDKERLYHIAFVQYVDALYKISNSANSFYYMDLLKPSKKKCTHILKTLLNYLHYVEMVKNEVSERANKLLKEYDDALTERNELQTKNEAIKHRSMKINQQLEDFEKKIPERQRTIKELNDRKTALTEESIKLHEELKSLESQHLNLEIKKNELQQLIVREEEYEGLYRSLEALQQDYAEVCQARESNQQSNIEDENRINELQKCLNIIQAIHNVQKDGREKAAKELISKVAEFKKEYTARTEEARIVGESIQQLLVLLADFENEYAKLETDLQELRYECEYKFRQLDDANRDLKELMRILAKRMHEIAERNSQLALMNNYLMEAWRKALTNMLGRQ